MRVCCCVYLIYYTHWCCSETGLGWTSLCRHISVRPVTSLVVGCSGWTLSARARYNDDFDASQHRNDSRLLAPCGGADVCTADMSVGRPTAESLFTQQHCFSLTVVGSSRCAGGGGSVASRESSSTVCPPCAKLTYMSAVLSIQPAGGGYRADPLLTARQCWLFTMSWSDVTCGLVLADVTMTSLLLLAQSVYDVWKEDSDSVSVSSMRGGGGWTTMRATNCSMLSALTSSSTRFTATRQHRRSISRTPSLTISWDCCIRNWLPLTYINKLVAMSLSLRASARWLQRDTDIPFLSVCLSVCLSFRPVLIVCRIAWIVKLFSSSCWALVLDFFFLGPVAPSF